MSTRPQQPIMQHLGELRNRIFKAAAAVVIGSIVAFIFRQWIFDILVEPYERITNDSTLAFFRPTEAFSLFMRLSLFGGLVLASPVIIYQIWAFVAPALTKREKRLAFPIVTILVVLFLSGIGFGYWSLQRGLGFLIDFGGDSLEPVIGGNFYMTFAMRFLLVFGIAFEFPVFLYAAAAIGIVGWRQLASARRWAVLIIVTVGAVVTPSGDPITLLLLSIPLYVFYEVTIWIVRFTLRR
ncbi:MAG: twin-arginine translocase subunit TatC [Acidimicrobiia bacterium]